MYVNRNGAVDSEDKRLRGWNFSVTDPAGKTTTNITNNRGEIIIEVPEKYIDKQYTIEESLSLGWKAILPKKQTVKVPKGKTTTVQFLNNESGTTLIIRKFSDSNRNGKVDSKDKRLQGWEFKVTDPVGKTSTHNTNDIGEIEIEVPREYEGKDYVIEEILKSDWVAVLQIKQIVKVPKGIPTPVNFLNRGKTGDLTISKFYDLNQNRVQDPREQGLASDFSITFPDGSVRRVTTAANGLYTLHNIPVGGFIRSITYQLEDIQYAKNQEVAAGLAAQELHKRLTCLRARKSKSCLEITCHVAYRQAAHGSVSIKT
jgi:hypothetical protein